MEQVKIELRRMTKSIRGIISVENDDGRIILRDFRWANDEDRDLFITLDDDHTDIKVVN